MNVVRLVGVVVTGMWLTWNLYRHVAVYAIRGRVVVLTGRVLGNVVGGAGLFIGLVAPAPATGGVAVLALALAIILRWAGLWVVIGLSTRRIMERAELVMRGMAFKFDEAGGRSLEESDGRIRVSIVASPGRRVRLLRVRTARDIKKVALFLANLRKFLVAEPRERGGEGL